MTFPLNLILSGIILVTLFSFSPSLSNEFISLDDESYIIQNPLVTHLSVSSVVKIFTSFTVGNYNPLSTLFLAIQYHCFGPNPYYFHLVNLLLHVLNTVLVFYFISYLFRKEYLALVVSALFALHPMHVESVVWASECKDTLFFLFYILALILYLKRGPYLGIMFLFILSLLSKPSAVSFPLALLLIDYYLGRFNKTVLIEKIPFFILSAGLGLIELYSAQTSYMPYESIPVDRVYFNFIEKILLSSFSVWDYLFKLICPVHLSVFYPYPASGQSLPLFYYLCFLGLLGALGLILKQVKQNKTIVFGVAFFICTILFNLPVLGVGNSISGDRFTYLPYLGLFIIIGFYGEQWLMKKKEWTKTVVALLVVLGLGYSYMTFEQCKIWRNSGTLWLNVIKNFPEHSMGYARLAEYAFKKGNFEWVIKLGNQALVLNPQDYSAHFNKGNAYLMTSRWDEALKEYTQAIKIFPYYHHAYKNRGLVLFAKNQPILALEDFNKALSIQPNDTLALLNRAKIYYHQKNSKEALADFNKVLELEPQNSFVRQTVEKINLM